MLLCCKCTWPKASSCSHVRCNQMENAQAMVTPVATFKAWYGHNGEKTIWYVKELPGGLVSANVMVCAL